MMDDVAEEKILRALAMFDHVEKGDLTWLELRVLSILTGNPISQQEREQAFRNSSPDVADELPFFI